MVRNKFAVPMSRGYNIGGGSMGSLILKRSVIIEMEDTSVRVFESRRARGRTIIKAISHAAFCLLVLGTPAHAQRSAPPVSTAFNGVCGSANGVAVTSAPRTNLCSAGAA